MQSDSRSRFITVPGFCPDCGSILPLLDEEKATVVCFACKRKWNSESLYFKRDTQVSIIKKIYDLDFH